MKTAAHALPLVCKDNAPQSLTESSSFSNACSN